MERAPLDWWLDRINLLIDMMGDVDLGGAVTLGYSESSLSALEATARTTTSGLADFTPRDPAAASQNCCMTYVSVACVAPFGGAEATVMRVIAVR